MLRYFVAVSLVLTASTGVAETMKSYKVVTELGEKTIKNAPCTLKANGVVTELRSPAVFKLPSAKGGIPPIESLSCTYKGKTLTTNTLADKRTVRVVFDFEDNGGMVGGVIFEKQNGGVASFYTPDGKLLTVN